MLGGQLGGQVIVVQTGPLADAELEQLLRASGAQVHIATSVDDVLAFVAGGEVDAVAVELGDDRSVLAELSARLPASTRLIALGDLRSLSDADGAMPDCVLLAHPDEVTLHHVFAPRPKITADTVVRELLSLSMFGASLPETLQGLAIRLARAFAADNCIIVLPEGGTCFLAHQVANNVVDDLVRLSSAVCRFAITTTVIAPPRSGRSFRAFLGLPLAHESGQPLALLLLCREAPLPFGRDAFAYLRDLADRLSADLSWRIVHERLLNDRDKLRELSRVDPMLGVANRTALQEELARRIVEAERRGESLCVAVVDVDGLRLINERSGYPAGDAVLAHVAQVARLETRAPDIVARYAGDSIAIVLPDTTAEQATIMLTRILAAIDATPVLHESRPINLTVSAGIAEVRSVDDTGEAALSRALAARHRARLHGEVIAIADPTSLAYVAQADFQIGATLGGVYQIRHEISRGAFGVVYRAEDLALGRQVALKLLRPDLTRDAAFVENFRAEAATLARVRHPNLVQVYTFGVDGPNVFFAMELIEGQGLDKRIRSAQKRGRHLPIPELLNILDQVAEGLEAVHRAGMVHRDVKPENVLIDRINRRCVLVDVGIAVRRGEINRAGTPGFTAPEVFNDGGGTPASDVYSLGALAYLLLTMEAPFGGGATLDILRLQTTERPQPLTAIRQDLPRTVDEILLPTLDPDPAQRPHSARGLAAALRKALAQPGVAPRMTLESPATQPIAAYNSLMRNPPSAPSTRGVLFRSAYEALGARRGSAWTLEVSRRLPELAPALAPQSSMLAWYPTSWFVTVLRSLATDEAECRAIATQLGRNAVDISFRQFYGADPSAVSPAQVLRTAELFWRCYHSWGGVSVAAGDTDAVVTVTDGVASALLCASTAGLLASVVARAGGHAVGIEHQTCLGEGADRCTFQLKWQVVEVGNTPTVRPDEHVNA